MTISIITPTLMRSTFKRCRDSVAMQTHLNIEHIVVADGAEALARARESMLEDSLSVRLIPLASAGQPMGVYGNVARFVGSYLATGDYVMYLDDDNYLSTPFAIERLVAFIEEHNPEWGVFPLKRMGQRFLNLPPARNLTDINQVFHRNGHLFLPFPPQNTDGDFVEQLKQKAEPLVYDQEELVIYEQTNFGQYF